ncbi:UNVERIFIED_CONTAM: hypothetical protein H355_005154 [Colinus virginianus]|nr:hypothetical protein H355_005154 [Colinus virginianus]
MWRGLPALALAALLLLGRAPAGRAAACEPVRIPLCKPLPWNMTKMPNHLHHSTQANAVLAMEQFEGLLGTNCSPDLLFFLCAMYAPICTIDFQHEPIKPCKSVCERARAGCEPVLIRYRHAWPESLACDELPLYDRGVCISPEAIVTAEGAGECAPSGRGRPHKARLPAASLSSPLLSSPPSSPVPGWLRRSGEPRGDPLWRGEGGGCAPCLVLGSLRVPAVLFLNTNFCFVERCKCKPIKATQKTYLRNNYNYVIRAKVKEVKTKCHDVTAVVEVKEILKSSLVNIPKDTVNLYTNSGCLCPPLSANEEYIIMGYEDEERSRLLLVEGSIAEKWKDRLGKKVKRWDQKLRHLGKGKGEPGQSDAALKTGKPSNPRQARS